MEQISRHPDDLMSDRPTSLIDLPLLAERCGVAKIWAKLESGRPLGNFKSLGGAHAALWALATVTGQDDVPTFLARLPMPLPTLVCASDGNHGLAVAAVARRVGAPARIYLPAAVGGARAARIEAMGATIIRVEGTYDQAVAAAAAASDGVRTLLIADTTDDMDNPVVAKVMEGYGRIALEIRAQLRADGSAYPTHAFIQAGVGGLAAAMAEGLCPYEGGLCQLVTVEPQSAPCVERALRNGSPILVPRSLETSAEMLSCGLASAPAVASLLRYGAEPLLVDEGVIEEAVELLDLAGGPRTTPSGATGLAGLLHVSRDTEAGVRLKLDRESRILLVVTEGV